MVIPVPAYKTEPGKFATEGAFAEHLRLLRTALGDIADQFTVAAPEFDQSQYDELKNGLAEVQEATDGIRFRPMFPARTGRLKYWLQLPRMLRDLREEVQKADVVHANSSQLYRPFEIIALVMAKHYGKTTVTVTDIDNRQSPRMMYDTGQWSLREYLWTKLVHSTWMHVQQYYSAKNFSVVLLKGRDLAAHYGKGRPNVHFFLDSAFSAKHIIPEARLKQKLEAVRSRENPLKVVYFGRLVAYKGIDRMLKAVRSAVDGGARIRFSIIGSGPAETELQQMTKQLGLEETVEFVGSIPFGPQLFDSLYSSDLLLASPLRQDTPRSALDAAAAGIPTLAYDTYYYQDLRDLGGAVVTVPWLDDAAMGKQLIELERDRESLATLMQKAVHFAAENTQETWLERRAELTRAAKP